MNERKINKQTICIRTKLGQVKKSTTFDIVIFCVRTACFKNNVTVLQIYE